MAFDTEDLRSLIRALESDPQVRSELAALMLSDETRQLSSSVHGLADAQARTERALDNLIQRVEELTEQMVSLTTQVAILTDQMGEVRGQIHELRYRDRGHAFFAPIARRLRVLDLAQIDQILDDAIDAGNLSVEDTDEVRLADLILRGLREGEDVLLVVETSATVDDDDVDRAARRAQLLGRAGTKAIAVTAGARSTSEAESRAREAGVWLVTNGVAQPPSDVADAS